MGFGFSVTNVLAGSTHITPYPSKDKVAVREGKVIGKDKHLFAECDPQGIDQGQLCSYLVLAAL